MASLATKSCYISATWFVIFDVCNICLVMLTCWHHCLLLISKSKKYRCCLKRVQPELGGVGSKWTVAGVKLACPKELIWTLTYETGRSHMKLDAAKDLKWPVCA